MNNSFSINKILGLGALLMVILNSCTKSDHFYKDYIIERTYVGKVDSVWIKPGENRMKMYWLNSKDLSANKLVLYWNDNKDSVIAPIDHAQDTGSFLLNNLEEGDYLFNIISTDTKGNRSLPIEKSVTIYGNTYRNGLLNQGIDHVVLFRDSAIILWNSIGTKTLLMGNEITYTDKDNKEQIVFAPHNSLITTIYNVDTTKEASVRSLYKPDGKALDDIYSNSAEFRLAEKEIHSFRLVSNSAWENGELIDFKLVRKFTESNMPSPKAKDIDICHLRGGGSKHNFLTINSANYSAFGSSYQDAVNSWSIRNKSVMIKMGNGTQAKNVYDGLNEFDKDGMEEAFENAKMEYGAGTERLTLLNTGDIILIHAIDRQMYIAVKVAYSEPDGIMDIEFKVSRP